MRKILWISAMLFFAPNLSMAEDEPSLLMEGGLASLIAFRDSFTIEYSDQVSDGCLPQPSRMKDKMELAIRQNGFSISTESFLPNKIKVTALGFSTNASSCAISLKAELEFWASVVVPFSQTVPKESNTLAPITYDFGSVILTGNKNGMQERVENQVKEFGDDLYLIISRAKDYISKKFPQIPQYHEQQKSSK
ncbi:hypothetical protein FJM67_15645 [Maribrevibacterium harenarium]|uniref:DUF4468 domain-containing protein n=1 Tax=Maribrevibacterium harenarium TaxID=2589817 RepID=A0A501WEF1_9GAMM|nr:hypothetical protein [Maribrevibacterium harenarium]TPE46720.1 hypothetical protein FJM67_15645 [Maribrevibacterium harenarium]